MFSKSFHSTLATIISSVFLIITGCGGGGGGGSSSNGTDTMTLNMSPLRIVGFTDDAFHGSLYPMVSLAVIPSGKTLLMRVRDPYGMGDYYSIVVENGWGSFTAPATPTTDEGEPDNNPIDAAILTWSNYLHRGLNPVLDEDWFSFTSSGVGFHYVITYPNLSGSVADPILEVYDPTPNLGPVTYTGDTTAFEDQTIIGGVFDPVNRFTMISMIELAAVTPVDINSFFLVFTGEPTPGDYPIRFAAPPFPSDLPGSVTGSIHIDQYDGAGGRIIGSFDLTIVDTSRTTTVSGNFDVTRTADAAGLLAGFKPGSPRSTSPPAFGKLKNLSAYIRGN